MGNANEAVAMLHVMAGIVPRSSVRLAAAFRRAIRKAAGVLSGGTSSAVHVNQALSAALGAHDGAFNSEVLLDIYAGWRLFL